MSDSANTPTFRGTPEQLLNALTEMLHREKRDTERAILGAAIVALDVASVPTAGSEGAFMDAVWDALKADANDLRKQQRIIRAFRTALPAERQCMEKLVEALRWVNENPGAHPANVAKVVTSALTEWEG